VYYLDPGTSAGNTAALNIKGVIANTDTPTDLTTGTFASIILKGANDTVNTSVCIEGDGNPAGSSCNGKIDAGTVDPPYTINGTKYATYVPSMTGVKEETTGTVNTSEAVPGVGYRQVIDFTTVVPDSDLWLFSKATNIKDQFDQMVVLLSPAGNTKAWYTMDPGTYQLAIYTTRPTVVSYRLTAPRFDAQSWSNRRKDSDHGGFVINDANKAFAINPNGNIIGSNLTPTATNLSPSSTNAGGFDLVSSTGQVIDDIASFSEATIANVTAGLVSAQTVSTNALSVSVADNITVAGQTLRNYIIDVVKNANLALNNNQPIQTVSLQSETVKTTVISPISDSGVNVQLGQNQTFGILNERGSPVAVFDNQGNATFSGTVHSSQLTVDSSATVAGVLTTNELKTTGDASISGTLTVSNDATISGTLYADRIVSRFGDISQLSASTVSATYITNVTNVTNVISPIQESSQSATGPPIPALRDTGPPALDATSSALLSLLSHEVVPRGSPVVLEDQLTIHASLSVLGTTALGQTTIAGALLVSGPVQVGTDGIETIADTLYIQRNKLAALDILDGTLIVTTSGDVLINGNLAVSGNLAVGGVLGVDTIAPVGNNDITVKLSRDGPDASGSANTFGKLLIKAGTGPPVATIDASGSATFAGDVTASGSGTFKKLNIATDSSPGASDSSQITSSSAGTAILPTGLIELAIPNNQVTNNSLIYITPISSTGNQVLYLKGKEDHTSFTVGIDSPVNLDIKFNWWIVN
jgi:hypothetical protein